MLWFLLCPSLSLLMDCCEKATMSSKITQDCSLAGKPNKGKVFITTSETYISVVFFFSSRAHWLRRPSSWWRCSLPNPDISPRWKAATGLARINSCLWGMENNGQEEMKHGDGMVGYCLLGGHMRRQFLRQRNQTRTKAIHLLANWPAAAPKYPPCWFCKLGSVACKVPLHVAPQVPSTVFILMRMGSVWESLNTATLQCWHQNQGLEIAVKGLPLSTDDEMDQCLSHHGDGSWHGSSCCFYT